jgi:hypothetical protein
MGEHYLNPTLLDDKVDLTKPELVVYEPDASGRRRLVALEYLVFPDAWDAPQPETAHALRRRVHAHACGEPVRPAAVLRTARVDLEVQPERHIRHVEPEGHLPLMERRGPRRTRRARRPDRLPRHG